MKKSLSQAIAVATLMGAAATAQAAITSVEVNHEGLGGALLYPLYTVENGASTLVSVVNTTDEAKAVKVRFVEAMNSAEVLDFHLYLSPQDVWSGNIVATADGGAKLVSNDTSCIAGYPNGFPAEGLPFRTQQIEADVLAAAALGQPVTGANQSAARTRVGHFEVIEMGQIDPVADSMFGQNGQPAVGGNPAIKLKAAITHVSKDGKRVPASCAAITNEWKESTGRWYAEYAAPRTDVNDMVSTSKTAVGIDATSKAGANGVLPPAGGLYGAAAIVNVPASWAASYDAVALVGVTDDTPAVKGGLFELAQHPRPGSIYPNLATDSIVGNPGGKMSNTALERVSKALAVKSVYNDYFVDANFGAETDLVLSFPTKRFFVNHHGAVADSGLTEVTWAKDPLTNAPVLKNGNIALTAGPNVYTAAGPWVVADYTATNAAGLFFKNAWNANTNKACEYLDSPVVYDKEETKEVVDDGFISPRPNVVGKLPLCYETNVVSINNSNTFGADLVRTSLKTPFLAGWIDLEAGTGYTNGLPAIGFANIVTKNGADSVVRNFAQTFKNKTK